jgi:hypothetical protein
MGMPLTGDENFLVWKTRIIGVMGLYGVWNDLNGKPKGGTSDNLVSVIIRQNVSDDINLLVIDKTSGQKIWEYLYSSFASVDILVTYGNI